MKLSNTKSFERIPVIYGIQNTINSKWYIGSCNDFKDRFERHRYYLRHNQHHSTKLQRAYNLYGEDAFEISILHNLTPEEDRFAEEERYINEYDSVKNGYNMLDKCVYVNNFQLSEEARNNFLSYIKTLQKSVIAINRFTGEVDNIFDSVNSAAAYYKTSSSNISRVCKGNLNYIKDHVFVYSENFDITKNYKIEHHCKGKPKSQSQIEKMRHSKKCRPVYQYDTKGNLVKSFYSVKEAERQLGIKGDILRYWAKCGTIHDGYIYKRNNH